MDGRTERPSACVCHSPRIPTHQTMLKVQDTDWMLDAGEW
jgi:hypothetical protein